MTTKVDTLVDHYLKDLETELRSLPANRRREILDEVGEHITQARAALDAETEAAIRTVLERLGDPADIAAEARDRFGMSAEPAKPATPWLEVATLVALVIPFPVSAVGVVLLWTSRLWPTREKRIGTLLALGVPAVALLGTLLEPPVTSGTIGMGELGAMLFFFVGGIPAAIYLAIRLRVHANTDPEPHDRSEQAIPWLEVITLVALLIPFLGWVVGMVLLWLSRIWITREKRIGTLLALGVGALALAALASPLEWLRPLLVMGLTLPTVIYLMIRLRAHTNALPATG
jgi:hypothetical protein